MKGLVYIDTSVLAKWYLNEDRSEEAAAFIEDRIPVSISTLTVVEMRSLLGRRRRAREIRPEIEMRVLAALEDDQRRGALVRLPVDDGAFLGAATLLAALPGHPLRTLDALHLTLARDSGAPGLATADRVLAPAASAMGLQVHAFG